ncbi:Rne/Rng family ribonuclease [Nocardioides sp. T2.26MG-1]|uniref:Rne/Rng family ribonuclease n=1 Tax=Nocardioides sp. T2.26MG-1 TaxID=3041166 RepID=UPI0024778F33|nr:Rne/Rng family ribonuclease [Nocardioides sp. T2.26MG-1]CAI9418558.1 Ribonuclease E [Nocardioides sp. T2.26MG-1]
MPDDLQPGAESPATTPDTTSEPSEATAGRPAKKAAAKKTAARKTAAKKTAKKAAAPADASDTPASPVDVPLPEPVADAPGVTAGETAGDAPVKKAAARKSTAKKAPAKKATTKKTPAKKAATEAAPLEESATPPHGDPLTETTETSDAPAAPAVLFQAPEPTKAAKKATTRKAAAKKTGAKKTAAKKVGGRESAEEVEDAEETALAAEPPVEAQQPDGEDTGDAGDTEAEGGDGTARRRRRRGGRRRRKPGDGESGQNGASDSAAQDDDTDQGDTERAEAAGGEDSAGDQADQGEQGGEGTSRRRRRRRRSGEDGGSSSEDSEGTVTRVRNRRSAEDEITAVSGSTRLEAKKQRRREGREAGRRRAPIVSEAEFLARRESVDRVMVIRQREDLIQIGVLEDRVLVEHYVARESQTSLIGNVYLGRVQNVLPSMEAAFIDIGKGRNAVLYAGEVNWSALGHKDGQPRKIESVLSSGQSVLVQVTKDPIGHKGARLTSQISLAGRFLVYVPDGTTSGISRKLPDTERNRLKTLLKEIVPDTAGVIVRTAAEGASEDELTRDVERLKARWEDIESKAKGSAPQLLYGEPDLTLKVVRDLFTEDFSKLVIQGQDAWDTVQGYVQHVAPDLEKRLERYEPGADGAGGKADVFAEYRIEEQISKGLDRKVWLPSGGSLVIDRTEAMTVVDVNTGKFTGSGGNLEETVTKNNLEAAEEIVRQLRLRDIGGIIVVDFIDMVLESNRDLVLRRLVECLGRDRTRHQVAEVTSLGLVQMTRKRIGTGLLEAFSENCEHCQGRGVIIREAPVEPKRGEDDARRGGGGGASGGGRRSRGGRGRGADQDVSATPPRPPTPPTPKDIAAMARPDGAGDTEPAAEADAGPASAVETAAEAPTEQTPPLAADETPERPDAEPVVEPVAEPVVEPVVESVPEPPRVVTRTRRRAASRPAGPPVADAAAEVSPVADVAPPGAIGSVGVPPITGAVEPGTADAEPGEGSVIEHVPVKKKGSRKR